MCNPQGLHIPQPAERSLWLTSVSQQIAEQMMFTVDSLPSAGHFMNLNMRGLPVASHFAYHLKHGLAVVRGHTMDFTQFHFPRSSELWRVYTDEELYPRALFGLHRSGGNPTVELGDTAIGRPVMNGFWIDLQRDVAMTSTSGVTISALDLESPHQDKITCSKIMPHDPTLSMSTSFCISITRDVKMAALFSLDSLALVDFRDQASGESSWLPRIGECENHVGYGAGLKASCRAYLWDCKDGRMVSVDRGVMKKSQNQPGRPSLINVRGFSEVSSTVVLNEFSHRRSLLFDVKRDALLAELKLPWLSVNPLFIAGQPQLIGINCRTDKVEIAL